MNTFIDFHILQTVPSSNMNRDDTGRPKTGYFGGFLRARVSSQAWKKATRQDFARSLPTADLAVRTRRSVEDLTGRIEALSGIPNAEARDMAKKTLEAAGLKPKAAKRTKNEAEEGDAYELTDYLVFISNQQLDRLAHLAVDSQDGVDKTAAKTALKLENGIEVALFGRMVADDTSINVDASVQVAHALSTHAVEAEFDYFTATDDKKADDEAGAGMIGTVEFNSSTLYRYATVNLDQLRANIGDDALVARAVEVFARSFITSMPTGKQNTFANGTMPDMVVVQVRGQRSVNLVGAFEKPIAADGRRPISLASAVAFAERARHVDAAFGPAPSSAYVVASTPDIAEAVERLGEAVSLETLVDKLGQDASSALSTAS